MLFTYWGTVYAAPHDPIIMTDVLKTWVKVGNETWFLSVAGHTTRINILNINQMAGKMVMQKNRNCRFFLLESTVGSKIDENRCKQKI